MNLKIERLQESASTAEIMASFEKPLDKITKKFLLNDGLDYVRVVGCMKWLWFQWLLRGSPKAITERTTAFVAEEMKRMKFSPLFNHRPRHNVLLLQCAIYASPKDQLLSLAEQVVDSSGFKNYKPQNNGELYESAWSGLFKYWILGDQRKALSEAETIWKPYLPPWLKGASKPLLSPWVHHDWNAFIQAQKKDFERLWSSGRKNGTVVKETPSETVVTVERYPVEQVWCWAHCGMALLAHRLRTVQVATDPFWFPAHALECVPV